MANFNRPHERVKTKARRRRREVQQFMARCAAINLQEQEKGLPLQDFSAKIRAFKKSKTKK